MSLQPTQVTPRQIPAIPVPRDRTPLERAQPHDLAAEQAVLGAIMLATSAIDVVAPLLRPGDFYRPAHEMIYRAILDLYGSPETDALVDPICVGNELSGRGQISRIGGPGYLHTCVNTVPTAANAEYYATIVRDTATLRHVIRTGTRMADQAYAALGTADGIVESAMGELQTLATGTDPEVLRLSVADRWSAFIGEQRSGIDPAALDTPWPAMNGIFRLLPGQLITVGADTGCGKSMFGLNLAAHVALRRQRPVLLASMEMSGSELLGRLTAAEAGISLDRLIGRRLNESDWARLEGASDRLSNAHNLILDDSASQTLSKLRARLRWMASRKQAAALLVADYLQLMTPETRAATRAQEVAEISTGLKSIATEFRIPVVALAQFNRGAAGRRPRPSDFKESSSIEQDSSIVVLLHRDDPPSTHGRPNESERISAIVAKNRNGASGAVVELAFQGHLARLASMEPAL